MTISLQKKNGFTLVELMIVVAVLAILVATIVIAQKTTVVKSKNTRILTAISETRKIAETIYMKEGTGYTNVCANGHLNMSSEELRILEKDIQANGGETFCLSEQNSYCLRTRLFNGQFFCIDDEGHFGTVTGNECTNENTTCVSSIL
jgi:prepilin-type N-terminal cleavage/methylation domain-containing protein